MLILDPHLTAHALDEGFALGEAIRFLGRSIERGTKTRDMVLLLMKHSSPLWALLEAEAGPFPSTGEARLLIRRAFLAPHLATSCHVPPGVVLEQPEGAMYLVLSGAEKTSVYGLSVEQFTPPPTPATHLN